MSAPPFERAAVLDGLGLEHGFGALGSAEAAPRDVAFVRQVHGVALARAPFAGRPEADALWSDAPGAAVGVVTADCVPILLAHREGTFACAIHAGWRGSAARIAVRTVRALARATGSPPAPTSCRRFSANRSSWACPSRPGRNTLRSGIAASTGPSTS